MSTNNTKFLAIIPARGGSKGIPRKNLRSLAGLPLIRYSIDTTLKSKYITDVYVSSEDDEILTIAEKLGAKVVKRKSTNSGDDVTLDPVINEAVQKIENYEGTTYDYVITIQPTSPLLKYQTLDNAIEKLMADKEAETVISVKKHVGLSWSLSEGKAVQNFSERLNRQYLEPIYHETGSFLISKRNVISETNRIGKNVLLEVLSSREAIDIDDYEDWNLCEYYLSKSKVLFVVSGYREIGLGHAYNALSIANEILNHEIEFLVDSKSDLAYDVIRSKNYKVTKSKDSLLKSTIDLAPSTAILDILDTNIDFVKSLKKEGIQVISFEDLGEGAKESDLVINAMYPEKELVSNHYFGSRYFILRDEFIFSKHKIIKNHVKSVLLTFGGVDPSGLTLKVLSAIHEKCLELNVEIHVILGLGYNNFEDLKPFDKIKVHQNVLNISGHMLEADLIFTSAGRTTFEVASIGTPTVILAQNERELTHFFASEKNGFVHLGLGLEVEIDRIKSTFLSLIKDFKKRQFMNEVLLSSDLKNGKERVISLVKKVIDK